MPGSGDAKEAGSAVGVETVTLKFFSFQPARTLAWAPGFPYNRAHVCHSDPRRSKAHWLI